MAVKSIVLVLGASGSGKDYLVDKVCKEYNRKRLCLIRQDQEEIMNLQTHIFL